MNEQTKQTKQPELPPEIAQSAQKIDEVLATLNKTREEHNILAGALRTIVGKVLELMEQQGDALNKADPPKPSK